MSIVLDRCDGAGGVTCLITWGTSEVSVDGDDIVLAELGEEAGVLIAWLWWGGLGATWVGTLDTSVAGDTGDETDTTRTDLDCERLLCERGGETRIDIEVLIVVDVLDADVSTST